MAEVQKPEEQQNSAQKQSEEIVTTEQVENLLNADLEEMMTQESKLSDFIQDLEKFRVACSKNKKFDEAQKIQDRINEIIQRENVRVQNQMLMRQQEELKMLEENQMQKFQEFNQEWDGKIQAFLEQSEIEEHELRKKHEANLQSEKEKFMSKLKRPAKPNPEILHLQKSIDTLSKRKEYSQAGELQQQLEALEKDQEQKWEQIKQTKLQSFEQITWKQYENEFSRKIKQIETQLNEMKKQRANQLEKQSFNFRMLLQHQNAKKQMQNEHIQQLNKLQHQAKLQSQTNNPTLPQMENFTSRSQSRSLALRKQVK